MSWGFGRRYPVLRRCKGGIFQLDIKDPPNGNEHCVFKRGKEVGLEKGKQGRSREERKSERSQTQTAGYSGEFVCV